MQQCYHGAAVPARCAQVRLILSPFIQDYLSAGGKWLHVDMAGPAFAEDRATGYGVALLSQLVRKLN
jgi:leucyl aminopeptidase